MSLTTLIGGCFIIVGLCTVMVGSSTQKTGDRMLQSYTTSLWVGPYGGDLIAIQTLPFGIAHSQMPDGYRLIGSVVTYSDDVLLGGKPKVADVEVIGDGGTGRP